MQRNRSRNALILTTVALVVLACLVFLFLRQKESPPVTSSPEVAPKAELTKVRVGYLPSLAASQLYIGIVEGFFQEEGLEVEISEIYSGPEIIQTLQARSVDIAFGIVPPLVMVRAKGTRIKSLGGATLDSSEIRDHRLLVKPGSAIRSPQDLRGKRIAVVAEPTSDGLGLLDYLESHGIKKDEVTLVKTPHPEQVFAVSTGAVDAAASIEPFITIGVLKGLVEEFDYYYSDEPTEVGTYLIHDDTLEDKPELAKRFRRALERATVICQDEDRLRKILPTLEEKGIAFKITPDVATEVHVMDFQPSLTIEGVRKVMGQLVRHGFLGSEIDPADCIYEP